MMHVNFTIFLIIFVVFTSYTQDFIADGSFEINNNGTDCSFGLHYKSKSWEGYGSCELFLKGTCAAREPYPYYILDDNDTIWSTDVIGYQLPQSGNHLAAIRLFDDEVDEWHEFIYTELTQSFVKDKLYKISFYVSVAESEEYISNSIGVGFSEGDIPSNLGILQNPFNANNPKPDFFYNLKHVMYDSETILDDYEDWVKLEFYYKATGEETHLVIGNFKDDEQTLKTKVRENCRACRPSTRLFLDNVDIHECGITELSLPEDSVVICRNESYLVDLNDYSYDIVWSDNNNEKERVFTESGNYKVTYSDEECKVEDSIFIYRLEMLVGNFSESICSDDDLPLLHDIDYAFHIDNRFYLDNEDIDIVAFEISKVGYHELKVENQHCIETLDFEIILDENNIQVFPNPFYGNLQLRQDVSEPIRINIYNVLGQFIGNYKVVDGQLDLESFSSGTYILRFENQCIEDKVVIKQH